MSNSIKYGLVGIMLNKQSARTLRSYLASRPLLLVLEVSIVKSIFPTLFLLFSLISHSAKAADTICEVPVSYQKYFKLKDLYSFTDSDFTEQNVQEAQARIAKSEAGFEIEYFIPVNDFNIIEGSKLLKQFLKAKNEFEISVKNNSQTWEIEVAYLETKFNYCEFIIHTRLIDW